jgi:predicted aldo/keto reductase-like oxidoreductase
VQLALASGIGYIDSSESYSGGKAETTLGTVIERTGKRKDVYLVTKNSSFRKVQGPGAAKIFEERLNKSLERLRTDYVDAYYLHGLTGAQIPLLFDDGVKAAFEGLKKAGKIRFAGLSCHDARLIEVVEAAAKCGWLDQIMIQYNFRTMDADDMKRVIDVASKANLGLVAMKSQGGAGEFKAKGGDPAQFPKFAQGIEKGFNPHQAAIKAVLTDERFQVVVSEMTNRTHLRENSAAVREPMGQKEARLLEEHRARTARMYCHGCGHLCETSANGVPVATVLRYLRYYEVYGKRQEARALYQALPAEARDLASADLAAAEAACPHGLPVAQLVQIAHKSMS